MILQRCAHPRPCYDDGKCHYKGECGHKAPLTNADRIRAMSDEELVNVVPCPLGFSMFRCPIERQCGPCKREWLKQPAEEDDHDERKENEHV